MFICTFPCFICFLSDDDSLDDMDDSMYEDAFQSALGTRPPLPNITLGPEYQPLIELFCACTDEDPKKRPSANIALTYLESVTIKDECWIKNVCIYYTGGFRSPLVCPPLFLKRQGYIPLLFAETKVFKTLKQCLHAPPPHSKVLDPLVPSIY